MTNEEAKKNLLAYAYYVDEPMPPDVAKAFDMAIKALEQPEPCEDAISRQAAIDAMAELQGRASTKAELKGISKAWKRIKQLPSAQPDAVTASLEELINDYGEDGYFIVDGVNYQANELLNELKINSSVGEKFRIQITKTIVAYFMKFGD